MTGCTPSTPQQHYQLLSLLKSDHSCSCYRGKKEGSCRKTPSLLKKKKQYPLVSCISDKVAARRVFDVGLNCNCCEHQEPGLKCSAFKFKWVFVWGLLFKFKVILLSIICSFFFFLKGAGWRSVTDVLQLLCLLKIFWLIYSRKFYKIWAGNCCNHFLNHPTQQIVTN